MFLPFTAILGEILFDDPISSVGFGIVFLELTSKSKNCLLHKMCCPKTHFVRFEKSHNNIFYYIVNFKVIENSNYKVPTS